MSSEKPHKKIVKESSQNHKAKLSCQNENCGQQKNQTTPNKNGHSKKLTLVREPFIFELWARGIPYREIAKLFEKEFGEKVDHVSIFQYINQFHPDRAKAFKEEFYANIKAIPIANAPVRIKELEDTRVKLKEAIDKIMVYEPRMWDTLNLASLVRELRGLTEQIQDEAGDKIQKVKGDGFESHQHNYFGDSVINAFADQTLKTRREATVNQRSGIKADRFSDARGFVSGN